MQEIVQKIRENTLHIRRNNVEKVLVMLMVDNYPIGDSVMFFSKMRAISRYFNNPHIDVLGNKANYVILGNSPFVKQFYFDLDEVDYISYDVIINLAPEDAYLADLFSKKYDFDVLNEHLNCGVFNLYLKKEYEKKLLFQYFYDFQSYLMGEYLRERDFVGHELYLTDDERKWGNDWFREQGVQDTEKVIVILDSTSSRDKMMRLDVYFDVLRFFMSMKNTRILVFDPDNIDKRALYGYVLQTEKLDNFLFVKRQGLRKDLCLLASDFVHMVIGPCTGLMHCAEGIYNVLNSSGILSRWPLLCCYLGPAPNGDPDKWFWWGETHVDCIYTEQAENEPDERTIKKLAGPGRVGLPCSEFRAPSLTKFFLNRYGDKFREWGMI